MPIDSNICSCLKMKLDTLEPKGGNFARLLPIKNILNKAIDEENKKKPLTDEALKNILQEKGYKIARRTVAKYREQLNLPVARLRKEL